MRANNYFSALAVAAFFVGINALAPEAKDAATLVSEFSSLFNGRTARIVWVSDVNPGNNTVMAMDTKDGNTFELMSNQPAGHMDRPTFTWDGTRVVFVDVNSGTIYVANWSSGGHEMVASGYGEGATCWRDPDGNDWVVAAALSGDIVRIKLDNPSEKVTIYNGEASLPSLSPDGEYLAASFPGFGYAGIYSTAEGADGTPLVFDPGG